MNMKRIVASVILLCMLLTAVPLSSIVYAVEEETVVSEDLVVNELDAADVDVDLPKNGAEASDLVLDEEIIDENEVVKVIIVMEGESIIEEDSTAVMNEETEQKAQELEENQAEVVAQIEEIVLDGESLEVDYNYTWLLNGVATQVPYGLIEDIRNLDGVKQVLIQPVYQLCDTTEVSPMTAYDGVMIGRDSTWGNGYTGKGIRIAILDTGLDIDHQNFQALPEEKLTDSSATKAEVEAVLANLNASARYDGLAADDVYYSSKVVFGFNYCNNNTDITHANDNQGDHGTHVAGIAAANKVEGSDVVGVAPDAQLYIMKVFGANEDGVAGASADAILAALEDALIMGVDVVNMSLGTVAGFTSDTEEVNAIYNRVAQTNTVLAVSAGNNYDMGLGNNWGTDANLTTNPDNGVLGAPGTYVNVMSVASVENLKLLTNYIDADGYQITYSNGANGTNAPLADLTGEYALVAVPGHGETADYEGLDVTGKVALVQRGVTSFAEKCDAAAAAGAVACLVYNNTSGTFSMDLSGCVSGIPCASISMASGAYMVSALEENAELKVSFPAEEDFVTNENAYQMSDFSSWGPGPDLSLQPDITAPGGNIYSTLDGGTYGVMSGTSMSAPNVAGIAALVMQYVRENYEAEDYRTLVQQLLMSTSSPLAYDDELFYSPRSQGSGLANAYDAVNTQAYLTVDGCDMPKAELGDDPDKTGSYSFTFDVTNISDRAAYYTMNTLAQTEGYDDYGLYFMSSTPAALAAATAESSESMVLTHDVDNSAAAGSHDAYLIYRAAIGEAEDAAWTEEAFRYDVNGDDAVSTADVQAYLDALVGNASDADLTATVLKVAAGKTAQVSVSIDLTDADKSYFDTYYANGGYVEGYTFLTALNTNGVDLSLPYLAFYGDWNEAPVLDNGNYWDLLNAEEGEVVGSQYQHVLWTNFNGDESYAVPGVNAYLDEKVDPDHIAVSPNGDGYFDTVDDMYISLLRNASSLTFRYSNVDTGDVYYEETVQNVTKSYYSMSDGQIIPTVYSWFEGEIPLYDWTDGNGGDLTNNTKLLLEVEALGVGEEEGDEETWAVPITVDLEAPELLSAKKLLDLETGKLTLELTFKENHSVAAVGLLSSDGSLLYAMEGVEDVEPDAEGYQNHTISFDITDLSGKLMVVLADYALNESYYGLNTGAAGTPYGDLVAFQYNYNTGVNGWVSFDADVDMDETTIFMSDAGFVCAEYINGYVLAQTEDGKLYGFTYESMLGDTLDLESTYITTLENVYQDLAYSYAEGKLFGLYTSEYEGYPTSEVYSINLKGEYFDEDMWTTIAPYQEDWFCSRGGVYGLTLAIDDAGTMYVLGLNYDWDTEGLTDSAHLWAAKREVYEYSWGSYVDYYFEDKGDTGLSMDYLQSMTWDHNAETLYWARFAPAGLYELDCELLSVNVETAECTKVGTLSGETCALFAPLTGESAEKEAHSNIPEMDSGVVGTPILRESAVTMNVGGTKTLTYDLDPWYTDYKEVVWSSSDTSVVTVDAKGTVTAVGTGSATITIANKADKTKTDACTVEVTALDLKLEGVISAQSAGLGNVTGVSTYKFEMVDGIASFGTVNAITAPEELNYGLSLATSELGRGSIWACEYGNTGMIYEIDPATGVVKDALMPIDGDMLFGLTYSESLDTFTGIMNMYLYVDMPLTHEAEAEMLNSYDEELGEFTWHKLNMLPYLLESNTGFVTNETGNGASSEIVFTGITVIEDSYTYEDTYKDYLGNWSYGGMVYYQATQTLVLMDNVGRLWYIDEITGMTKTSDDWGNVTYISADGMSEIMLYGERNGLLDMEYGTNEDGSVNCSVFYIREVVETPLTDMFREGSMPRITYHFSDIEYAGKTAAGAPMFVMSLYDYWNNGTTNKLYLYTAELSEFDWDMYEDVIIAPERLFDLGDTGKYNIIATIHNAEVTGGVDPEDGTSGEFAANVLAAGTYKAENS